MGFGVCQLDDLVRSFYERSRECGAEKVGVVKKESFVNEKSSMLGADENSSEDGVLRSDND
jgi:hypothetical protein